jgi:hypothetical protein
MHLYSEILEHFILKLSGKSKSSSASVLEVTSMQVYECIGGMEIPHSKYPCLRLVYLGEFKGCDWPPFFAW